MLDTLHPVTPLQPYNVFFDNGHPCINFTYKNEKFCLLWTSHRCIGAFFEPKAKTQCIINDVEAGCDAMLASNKLYQEGYHTHYGTIEHGFHK